MFKKSLIFLSVVTLTFTENIHDDILEDIIYTDLKEFKQSLKEHQPNPSEKMSIEAHIVENLLHTALDIDEELSLMKMLDYLTEYEATQSDTTPNLIKKEIDPQKNGYTNSFLDKIRNNFTLTRYSNTDNLLTIEFLEKPARFKDYIKNPLISRLLLNFNEDSNIILELTQKRKNYLEKNYMGNTLFNTKLFSYSNKIDISGPNQKLKADIGSDSFLLEYTDERYIHLFRKSLENIFSMILLVKETDAFDILKRLEAPNKDLNSLKINIDKTSKTIENVTKLYAINIIETQEQKELQIKFHHQQETVKDIKCILNDSVKTIDLILKDNWDIYSCKKIYLNNKPLTVKEIEDRIFPVK